MHTNHLTILKSWSLLGVLLFHVTLPFVTPGLYWKFFVGPVSPYAEFCNFWANLILIPAFSLASGYLAVLSQERNRRSMLERIRERAKRLLKPWLLLSLLWMVPLYVWLDVPASGHPQGASLIETYPAALTGLFADHLWFLLALFWVSLFWALIQPIVRRWGVFSGVALSLIAALVIQLWGQGLTWYCICETPACLIHFAIGQVLGHYRTTVEKKCLSRPVSVFVCLAVFVFAGLFSERTVYLYWLASSLGAVTFYLIALFVARRHQVLLSFKPYAYFETHSFHFYLFHMPGSCVAVRLLVQLGLTEPLAIIPLAFGLNLVLTAGLVALFGLVEKNMQRKPR